MKQKLKILIFPKQKLKILIITRRRLCCRRGRGCRVRGGGS